MNLIAININAQNDDLKDIIEKIKPFTQLTEQCAGFDCPNFDCDESERIYRDLVDARKYMQYMHFWLSLSAEAKMEHFTNLVDQAVITTERAAKIQDIIALQEYIVNGSGAWLDIRSAAGSLKDLSNNKTLANMSRLEFIDNIDTFMEGIKDFSSLNNTLKNSWIEEIDDRPKMFSLGNEELDNYKSTLSDIKSIVQEAYKTGKNWRNSFKSNGRAGMLAIVGRIAKSYADAEIKERRELVESLKNEVTSIQLVQSNVIQDLFKAGERRDLAKDAFKALDKLLHIRNGSGGSLTKCLLKNPISCSSLNLSYISQLDFPSEFQIFDLHDIADHRPLPIKKATQFFDTKLINEVPLLLNKMLDIEPSASVDFSLNKTNFIIGESINVEFSISPCFGNGSWIGIVPIDVDHGNEMENSRAVIGRRYQVRGPSTGKIDLIAPGRGGIYDIRLNNHTTGFEEKSIRIVVDNNNLTGDWTNKRGSTYRFSQQGSSVNSITIKRSERAIKLFGHVLNDWHIKGTFEGNTIRGKVHLKYPIEYKEKCPLQWDHESNIELTLSENGNELRGRLRTITINDSDCSLNDNGWREVVYERVSESN